MCVCVCVVHACLNPGTSLLQLDLLLHHNFHTNRNYVGVADWLCNTITCSGKHTHLASTNETVSRPEDSCTSVPRPCRVCTHRGRGEIEGESGRKLSLVPRPLSLHFAGWEGPGYEVKAETLVIKITLPWALELGLRQ